MTAEVVFMDASHGDATFRRHPDGFLVPVHCAAADLAGFPARNRGRAVICMPFFLANSRGIGHRGQVGRLICLARGVSRQACRRPGES
jgi:hypothetical protein